MFLYNGIEYNQTVIKNILLPIRKNNIKLFKKSILGRIEKWNTTEDHDGLSFIYAKISKYYYIYKDKYKLDDIINNCFQFNTHILDCIIYIIKYLKKKKSKLYKKFEIDIICNFFLKYQHCDDIHSIIYYIYLCNKYTKNIINIKNYRYKNPIDMITKFPVYYKFLSIYYITNTDSYIENKKHPSNHDLIFFSIYYALFFKKTNILELYIKCYNSTNISHTDQNNIDFVIMIINEISENYSIFNIFLTNNIFKILTTFIDDILNKINTNLLLDDPYIKKIYRIHCTQNKNVFEKFLFEKFIALNIFNTIEFTKYYQKMTKRNIN